MGSLLREVDFRKKQTESDFIKSFPSQPGKEFQIKKRLDKLRGTATNNFNNNVNPGGGGVDIISGLGPPPTFPKIEDLIDNGPSLFQPPLHLLVVKRLLQMFYYHLLLCLLLQDQF